MAAFKTLRNFSAAKKRQKRIALSELLDDSDDFMAFELDAKGDPKLKTATLFGKMRFEPKNVKKMGFSGSSGLH